MVLLKLAALFCGWLFLPLTLASAELIEGKWGNGGIKSIGAIQEIRPYAVLDEQVLLVHFYEAMPLVITVRNVNNEIVLQETIYGSATSDYTLPLNLPEGAYQLTMANPRCGSFNGCFEIDTSL